MSIPWRGTKDVTVIGRIRVEENKDELKDASAILTKARAELGVTIIWVEHIMHVLMKLVERVIVLNHGLLIADGDPDTVSSDKQVVEAYLGAE